MAIGTQLACWLAVFPRDSAWLILLGPLFLRPTLPRPVSLRPILPSPILLKPFLPNPILLKQILPRPTFLTPSLVRAILPRPILLRPILLRPVLPRPILLRPLPNANSPSPNRFNAHRHPSPISSWKSAKYDPSWAIASMRTSLVSNLSKQILLRFRFLLRNWAASAFQETCFRNVACNICFNQSVGSVVY